MSHLVFSSRVSQKLIWFSLDLWSPVWFHVILFNVTYSGFSSYRVHDYADDKNGSGKTGLEDLIRMKADVDEFIKTEEGHVKEEEEHAKDDKEHVAKMKQYSKELEEKIKKASSK